MTMNSTGQLSMGGSVTGESINIELGQTATTTISLNDTNVRTLLQVPSGAISMSDAYGKSNRATATQVFSANTTSTSINISALSGYVAGSTDVTITVNTGVYLYSTATASYALTLTGGAAGDTLTLINNGFIMGMGGAGGAATAFVGGPAIDISGIGVTSGTISINNQSGYIGGGGGGGAGNTRGNAYSGGGGGAGGGAGGTVITGGGFTINGGAGGTPGNVGSDGAAKLSGEFVGAGGGGGRIMPGTGGNAGSVNSTTRGQGGFGGGAGGGGGAGKVATTYSTTAGSFAGGGGGYGASGGRAASGSAVPYVAATAGGAGGSAGAVGSDPVVSGAALTGTAGAGGKAINIGTKIVSWVGGTASSNRSYGAVA